MKTSSTNEETSSSSSSPHEPGVSGNLGANGSASIDGSAAASPPNTTTSEHIDTTNGVYVPHTETNTKTPAGKDIVQAATVRVPTSYFTAIYRQMHPAVKDPDDAALTALTTTELVKIRQGVRMVVGLKSENDLSVDTYTDIPVDLAMATGPSTQVATLSTVSGHAKEIGVAVLAIISLMMMATLVRKSAPTPMLLGGSIAGDSAATGAVTAGGRSPLSSLIGAEMVAGEVGGFQRCTGWNGNG